MATFYLEVWGMSGGEERLLERHDFDPDQVQKGSTAVRWRTPVLMTRVEVVSEHEYHRRRTLDEAQRRNLGVREWP